MNDSCALLAPLLARGPLGILDDASRARVDRHLATGCDECQGLAADVVAALGPKKLGVAEAPPGALEAVLARVSREDAARALRPAPTVVLACTYCRGALTRLEAVFCAGCIAPVHEDCFLEHGRCAAPGCSETRIVRPSQPALPRRRSRAWPLVALVASGAVAALVGDRALRGGPEASLAPGAPATPAGASPPAVAPATPSVSSPATPSPAAASPAAPSTTAVVATPDAAPSAAPSPGASLVGANGPAPDHGFDSWDLPAPSRVVEPAPSPAAPETSPPPQGAGTRRAAIFAKAELDRRGEPTGLVLKDGTAFGVSTDLAPERARALTAILLTLAPGARIVVQVERGVVVDVRKGWPADAGGAAAPAPARDPVVAQQLLAGDTVRIGFLAGLIVSVTPTDLEVREWRHEGTWGPVRRFERASLPPVQRVPLWSRRRYPVTSASGEGEVVVEIERSRAGATTLPLRVKATVWHSLPDRLLSGAVVRFVARRTDGGRTFGPEREDVIAPPLFCGDRWSEERGFADAASGLAEGDVTLELDPGRNLVAASAPAGKAAALAEVARRTSDLAPVWAFLARSGDADVALLLASRRIELGETAAEVERKGLDAALEVGGPSVAAALVEHVLSNDASYRLPEARLDGLLHWRDESAQATRHKRSELALLVGLPTALQDGRGRKLFGLYSARGVELGEGVLAVFEAHVKDAVDELLELTLEAACASRPGQDQIRQADAAVEVIRKLGEPALEALSERTAALGQRGSIEARKLRSIRAAGQEVPDVIAQALQFLVEARRTETHARCAQLLEDARTRTDERRWSEAIALLESVRRADRESEAASRLLATALVGSAQDELAAGHRGPAAALLERALAVDARCSRAAAVLGGILLDAAREDAAAVCIRAGPGEAWAVVWRPAAGSQHSIASREAVEDWIPVRLDRADAPGWIHMSNGVASGGGERVVIPAATGAPALVRETLARAVRLAPELMPAADAIDGDLWLRDAESSFHEHRYVEALAHYDQGARLLPGDPRLANRFWCQLRVNAPLLALLATAALGFGVVLPLGLWLARRRARRTGGGEKGTPGKSPAK